MSKKPVMLCIMDGFGWTPNETYGNAVAAANKPFIDSLMAKYPMTTIDASGMAVGLPDGQMGNSEVGHTNMGAGRIVYQQLTLITKSIKDGEMFKNPVLVKNMKAAIDAGKAIHLMGLVGTGGVHSHADHWFGVLEMAKHMGAKDVYLHCIMDGRDTDPHSGKGFLADLQAKLDELGVGKIASVSGRYYAMDRDNNWDREEKAYAAFVYGEGNHAANAQEAIEASYADDKTDEFVLPCVTCEGGRVQDGDTVIFMNFRPDRARQMTRIFCDDNFTGFERRGGRKQVHYVCMAEYDATMPNCEVAYPPVELKNTLGEYLAAHGKTQLRIAETEKYAHVTFFLNGKEVEKMVDVRASLTDMLRNDFSMTSVKKGCEVGECGACNVIIDGEAFNSCIYLAVWAEGKHIRTLESLMGPDGELSDIQQAFIEETAVQCGFCTPGFIMTAVEILETNRLYTDDELRKLLSGHLCRCTGYENIFKAVKKTMLRRLGRLDDPFLNT